MLITLEDNSTQQVSDSYKKLSPIFNTDELHIHTNLEVFTKLTEFCDYYLSLEKKDRKNFEDIEQLFLKQNEIKSWCNEFLNIKHSLLIQLTNQSSILKLDCLTNLCCYGLSLIIKANDIDTLFKLFETKNEYTNEELLEMNKEIEMLKNIPDDD